MGKNVNQAAGQSTEKSWIETENGCKFILKMKENEQGRLTGSVQPLFGNAPLEFYEIGSLILALDRLMDEVGGPVPREGVQSSENENAGTDNSKIYNFWLTKEMEHGSIVREIPPEERDNMQKNTELFFVCVRYRRYGSWQGEIQWNGKSTRYFRSELELIRLIQSVFAREEAAQ